MKSAILGRYYQCIEEIQVELELGIKGKEKSFLAQEIIKLSGRLERCVFCHENYFEHVKDDDD